MQRLKCKDQERTSFEIRCLCKLCIFNNQQSILLLGIKCSLLASIAGQCLQCNECNSWNAVHGILYIGYYGYSKLYIIQYISY